MAMAANAHREWAKLGAAARLRELESERASILKAFPDLRRNGGGAASFNGNRPRRRFSAAARRRMSAGMRKYWARRKAAKASKPQA